MAEESAFADVARAFGHLRSQISDARSAMPTSSVIGLPWRAVKGVGSVAGMGARFAGRGASKSARFAGRSTLRAGKGVHGFILDHPSTVIIPTVLAATHPLRHMTSAYGNTFYDNPDAIRTMAIGGAIGGFLGPGHVNAIRGYQPGYGINVGTMTPGITNEDITNAGAYDPDDALRQAEASTSPNGSIIFGLYNNRLR